MAWVVMWSGSEEDIPKEYKKCDGTEGTPDLRERFIKGKGSDLDPDTGGTSTHTHGHSSASHNHTLSSVAWAHQHEFNSSTGTGSWKGVAGGYLWSISAGGSHTHYIWFDSHTHTIGTGTSLPSYYNLVYLLVDQEPPLPKDSIVGWYGSIGDIPAGWLLCDGSLGTPDLRDKFIKGASSPGATGGGTHTHTITSASSHTHTSDFYYPGHSHTAMGSGNIEGDGNHGMQSSGAYHDHGTTGSGGAHDHGGLSATAPEPPFYALAWIIKT